MSRLGAMTSLTLAKSRGVSDERLDLGSCEGGAVSPRVQEIFAAAPPPAAYEVHDRSNELAVVVGNDM